MTALPVLTTERLVLRISPSEDAPIHAAYSARNFERLRRAGPIDERHRDVAFWKERLAEQVRAAREGTRFAFTAMLRDRTEGIVGKCTISDIVRGPLQAANLGLSIDHAHEGRGFATEAVRAVIAFAFDELNLHRISAGYQPWNAASGRVLARCGFRIDGYATDYLLLDGAWRDHVLASLVNPSWRPNAE